MTRLVMKGYEHTSVRLILLLVKLTTFRYLISLVGRFGRSLDHKDIVTTFLNFDGLRPIVNDCTYIILPEGIYTPTIARLKKALMALTEHRGFSTSKFTATSTK
jgi:hypothetical protein